MIKSFPRPVFVYTLCRAELKEKQPTAEEANERVDESTYGLRYNKVYVGPQFVAAAKPVLQPALRKALRRARPAHMQRRCCLGPRKDGLETGIKLI